MIFKIINFTKNTRVEQVLKLYNCRHEEVITCESKRLFELCNIFFDHGLDVQVLKQVSGNVLLKVSESGFSVKSNFPDRGVKTGPSKAERKYGECFAPSQVLPFVRNRNFKDTKENLKVDFNGDLIDISSSRLVTFKEKGCKCVSCGLEGSVFFKERYNDSAPWHFAFYGYRNGVEILFTKDHIIPVSKGGKDSLSNLQTMCTSCNNAKGDKLNFKVEQKNVDKNTVELVNTHVENLC